MLIEIIVKKKFLFVLKLHIENESLWESIIISVSVSIIQKYSRNQSSYSVNFISYSRHLIYGTLTKDWKCLASERVFTVLKLYLPKKLLF